MFIAGKSFRPGMYCLLTDTPGNRSGACNASRSVAWKNTVHWSWNWLEWLERNRLAVGLSLRWGYCEARKEKAKIFWKNCSHKFSHRRKCRRTMVVSCHPCKVTHSPIEFLTPSVYYLLSRLYSIQFKSIPFNFPALALLVRSARMQSLSGEAYMVKVLCIHNTRG